MAWKIEYYLTPSGKDPVFDFIQNLGLRAQTKVFNTLNLLAEFGVQLGAPHSKKVIGTPLWELRILGENSLRFFYIAKIGQSFLLLHGFLKKKQKTPKKEIRLAIERLKDFKNRS